MHEKRKQKRLTKCDRDEIHILVRKRYTQQEIATCIGVTQGAIAYELSEKTRKGRRYDARYAQHVTRVRQNYRRIRPNTIVAHDRLRSTIEALLLDDQSPEHIAAHLARYQPDLPTVSGVTIRTFIRSPYGRRIEIHRHRKLKRRGGRNTGSSRITDKRMIDTRPRYINERQRVGDMEGDFIAPGRDGTGLLLIHTDRRLRYPLLEKIHPVSVRTLTNAIGRMKRRYPEMRTVTWDNDILLICHRELERRFGIRIYFCHPYQFWEKGGVENRNKIIRRYIPKGSDISRYSRGYIRQVEEKLQRRIMACLQYRTPAEALARHRKRKQKQ